jgi:hypothetical protein
MKLFFLDGSAMDEIATSFNKRTIGFLAMTDLDSFSLDGRRSG